MKDINERIAELQKIANEAKILNALPLEDPMEEDGVRQCPACWGEGVVEYKTAAFETQYESISAGIQCFGMGEQLNASEALVNAIPEMMSVISELQKQVNGWQSIESAPANKRGESCLRRHSQVYLDINNFSW